MHRKINHLNSYRSYSLRCSIYGIGDGLSLSNGLYVKGNGSSFGGHFKNYPTQPSTTPAVCKEVINLYFDWESVNVKKQQQQLCVVGLVTWLADVSKVSTLSVACQSARPVNLVMPR